VFPLRETRREEILNLEEKKRETLSNIGRRYKYRSYKEDWGRKEIKTEGLGQERTGKEETKQPGEKKSKYMQRK
jgi:hypothetical protein